MKKKETGYYKKDKKYIIDKVYKGERIERSGKTKAEAKEKIEKAMQEIDTRINDGVTFVKDNMTFKELFALCAEQRSWSEYTFKKNNRIFNNYFTELIDKKVNDINETHIRKWYKEILSMLNDGKFQMHYANKMMNIMTDCLENAYELGRLKSKIDTSYFKKYKGYQESKKNPLDDDNYITLRELNLICNNVFDLPIHSGSKINRFDFCFILKFLFFTGCRVNEARAIKVKDIKTKIETINNEKIKLYYIEIKNQLEDNTVIFKPVKTGNERITYIVEEFQKELECYIEYKKYKKEDFIFDINKKGFPISRKKIHDSITNNIKALKENNLIDKHFIDNLTPHGLRYSNTQYFRSRGISEDISSQNRGHSQLVMLDVYSRIDTEFIEKFYTYDYIEGEELL